VLLSDQLDLVQITARTHPQAHPDVVARPDLVHEPTDTVNVVVLMTRHNVYLSRRQERKISRFSDGILQSTVLLRIIPIRDVVWIDILSPRALGALLRAL
jgi:hypothetical protein